MAKASRGWQRVLPNASASGGDVITCAKKEHGDSINIDVERRGRPTLKGGRENDPSEDTARELYKNAGQHAVLSGRVNDPSEDTASSY